MTTPKFTEATAEALRTWRINTAQDIRYADPISEVPLAVSSLPNFALPEQPPTLIYQVRVWSVIDSVIYVLEICLVSLFHS